ncbi:hypothetical protein [Methanosphaera sp. WGK6]|uniref:hypothetical protein n=1 Tax=Methanosphaera sp. WGK6 TaxID=1561964 RepID=UPI001F5229CF|nr:hypothetical protein [Methanosphaera sp. WGK6]
MTSKILIPHNYFYNSLQLNLSDFGLSNPTENGIYRAMINPKSGFNRNKFKCFVNYTYYYAQLVIPKYYSKYSNHIYNNIVKFTIIAAKIYKKATYREIEDIINVSGDIKKILGISKSPHYSTLQKFFKNMPTKIINDINNLIVSIFVDECYIIALDGTGFTSDKADKYYAKIRKKERKSYIKYHVAVDVDTRLILHMQAQRGPRHDTQFAKSMFKKYKTI